MLINKYLLEVIEMAHLLQSDSITVRTSIPENLKKRVVFRGTILGVIGMLPILLAGSFLSVEKLSTWGLPIFIIGGALVCIGLIPYRKLIRQERSPNTLSLNQEGILTYIERNKTTFKLSLTEIRDMKIAEHHTIPGIELYLQNNPNTPVFLPYFSKRSAEKIITYCLQM